MTIWSPLAGVQGSTTVRVIGAFSRHVAKVVTTRGTVAEVGDRRIDAAGRAGVRPRKTYNSAPAPKTTTNATANRDRRARRVAWRASNPGIRRARGELTDTTNLRVVARRVSLCPKGLAVSGRPCTARFAPNGPFPTARENGTPLSGVEVVPSREFAFPAHPLMLFEQHDVRHRFSHCCSLHVVDDLVPGARPGQPHGEIPGRGSRVLFEQFLD